MNIYNNRANTRLLHGPAVLVILLSALMSACATVKQQPSNQLQSDLIADKLDSYILEKGEIRHDVKDQKVATLWQESEILYRNGDVDNALSRLQQALEITPRDAVLWSRAAEFALDQSANLRAENYAAKSNFLTALGNRPLRYRNWLIIQRSRQGRGDLLGAREAEIETARLTDGS